ncbi:MAG: bacillithiol biosynthesis deacetylase BshB1 [Candidatus Syntrophonatronum acetioxidans]|uniref:Bacillithiol biosynthesis deacetylase BshB1 n=1 Tax=Candidatus Syntrophonatronum acetioxidans TaxID=1795816 RepID=A0A424YGL5_9FIRM|nr:MAG: bacillithiol biosynthesis deacetylase BshB1 [Candidatus Syntrophonatronum acetioxidans]
MLDILAFGAHPDDVEIGIGGTLAYHGDKGYQFGIVDLTGGERATNGTPQIRAREGKEAAEVLGAKFRECAGLPDAFLRADRPALEKVVEIIRKYAPRVVLCSYPEDRHPDHEHAGRLVREACHLAGLKKFPAGGTPYRPTRIYYYFLGKMEKPQLIVDISDYAQQKWKAIACHKSQFQLPREVSMETLVNSPIFMRYVWGRDQYFGSLVGVQYGEGLISQEMIKVNDLLKLGG